LFESFGWLWGLGRCACFGLFLVCGGMGIAVLGEE
jgi:hypothetical protein